MVENLLQVREKEIFRILFILKDKDFVLIGGYAVNVYTLPRFSVDCDIVIRRESLRVIEKILIGQGYVECNKDLDLPYFGKFKRFEKRLDENFFVSIDILVDEIKDRQTGSIFSADWVFANSHIKKLRGKTMFEELNIRVLKENSLFVTKMVSCRKTDIRDMFLLVSEIKDFSFVKKEVSARCSFEERKEIFKREIESKQFRDGLQGVFGVVDSKLFERNQAILKDSLF
jgi:hypothetical protein